jgi:hypothetical protein
MRRGLIFVILLISLSYFVYSESKTDLVMNQNDNLTLAGREIKFLYASSNSAAFSVDGTNTIAYFNTTKLYRDVKILLKEIYGNNIVLVDITVDKVCGDGQCQQDEDCCKDCSCSPGLKCLGNNCLNATLDICTQDSDCNDNTTCTIDKCSGYKGSCSHEPLTSCISGDDCCPGNCNDINDTDCSKCSINECFIDNKCLKEGDIYNNSYCLASRLSAIKSADSACSNNFECISGSCQNKVCVKAGNNPIQKSISQELNLLDQLFKDKDNQYAILVLTIAIILIYLKFRISRRNNL